MRARKSPIVNRKSLPQPTSPELLEELLRFIQVKFYPENAIAFAKDKPRLISWVVMEFNRWLASRAVTLPPARYLEILRDQILMDALRHGSPTIAYVPAYLRHIVQQHLAHHGDEIYEDAKSIRTLSDRALWAVQRAVPAASDPVRDLAKVDTLLRIANRGKKRPVNDPVKRQLTLL